MKNGLISGIIVTFFKILLLLISELRQQVTIFLAIGSLLLRPYEHLPHQIRTRTAFYISLSVVFATFNIGRNASENLRMLAVN